MPAVAEMKLQFGDKVGEGGTGIVWRATDEAGRDLAVKFFHQGLQIPRDLVVQHIESLKAINHPSVVTIFGIVDCVRPDREGADAEPAVIMEFVSGESFADWLSRGGKPREEVRSVLTSLLDGLAQFHKKNLVHGDLHSDNVRVCDGQAKLIDPVANDPAFVVSSALTVERRRRDISEAQFLIRQSLVDAGGDPKVVHNVSLFESGSTIEGLQQQVELALRGETSGSSSADRSVEVGYYGQCLEAQRTNDRVAWQALRDAAIRSLKPQLDTWLQEHPKLPAEDQELSRYVFACVDELSLLTGILLSAA